MGERADEIKYVDVTGRDRASYADEPGMAGMPATDTVDPAFGDDVTWSAGTASDEPYVDDLEAPDSGTADDDIEATRAQIEQTRSQMSQTIDAIQERLAPSNLVEQAKDSVREATIGKASTMINNAGDTAVQAASEVSDTARGLGSGIVETIRRNPVPAALAGIGLGWLFMSSRKGSDSSPRGYSGYSGGQRVRREGTTAEGYPRYSYSPQYDYGYGQEQYTGRGSDAQSGISQAAGAVGQGVNQARDTAGQAVSQVQDTAGQAVNQVQDTAGQVAGQVQDTATQVGYQAQYGAQRAASGFQEMLQDRPLAVAAGAVALGLAVGLAVPSTPKENELMGETRDTLMQQAQEAVGAAKDQAQQEFGQR